MVDLDPDVICLVETWTNDSHTKAFLSIDGYEIVCRHDRTDTKKGIGGGLLIYCKDSIPASESYAASFNQFNQCCSVSISCDRKQPLELVLVYRPHNLYDEKDVSQNNSLLCDVLHSVPTGSVIVGDFNCSDIDWSTLSAEASKQILDTVNDCFMVQHIDFPTQRSSST